MSLNSDSFLPQRSSKLETTDLEESSRNEFHLNSISSTDFQLGHYRRSSEDIVRRFLRRKYAGDALASPRDGKRKATSPLRHLPPLELKPKLLARVSSDSTSSPPRTPRLGHRPAGLAEGLKRVPSVVFRLDPDRQSLRSRSEDKGPVVSVEQETGEEHGKLKRKKSGKWRDRMKKFKKKLKRQKSVDESSRRSLADNYAVSFDSPEEDETDYQEPESCEGLEKKRPSLIQRVSTWLGIGNKFEEASDPPLRTSTRSEPLSSMSNPRYSIRRSSYHEAMDTLYFPQTECSPMDETERPRVTSSSTAEPDVDSDEYAQEILADSGAVAGALDTNQSAEMDPVVQESVVDRLEELGKKIEERMEGDLAIFAKSVELSSLTYSAFSKLAQAVVKGTKATRTGVMKLLLFGSQVAQLIPLDMNRLEKVENFTAQAVEEYAGSYIASSGGLSGLAQEMSYDENSFELDDMKSSEL
eukprot:m.4696 g.4696  ORF g.4696 m.4696 type:complete len:470 (+) comp11126_c0_seq1:173-1582(+)